MGKDKSRLTVDGQSFVDLISKQLSSITSKVTLVGAAGSDSSLPRVADVYGEWGALGGVHAALAACSAGAAIVVACDFPFVTRALFQTLADASENFDAVAPIQADGIPQPLCAFYRVNPCLQQTEALIKSGERRPIALLQSVRTRWLQFGEVAKLENASRFFDNINTPEDYDRITGKGSNTGNAGPQS